MCADLTCSDLTSADLTSSHPSSSHFSFAHVTSSGLTSSYLMSADLACSDLMSADLTSSLEIWFSLSLSLFFSLFCYFYSFLRRGSGHKRLRKCDGSVRSEVWCSKLPKIEILNCPGRPLRRKWGSIVQNRAKKKQFGLVVQDCNAQNDVRSSKNWLYFGNLGSRFPSIVWYLLVEYWGKRLCVKRIDVQQGLCEKTFVCKRLCL